MTFSTMCALRVYLRRGDNHREEGFLQRLFRRPLSTHLLQRALKHGVTHAALHLRHSGFTRGTTSVATDVTEIPVSTLPVCLELVGPKQLLEQFVREHAKALGGATLVMLEGVHIATELESVPGTGQHPVEYIKSDALTVPLDLVNADAPNTTAAGRSQSKSAT